MVVVHDYSHDGVVYGRIPMDYDCEEGMIEAEEEESRYGDAGGQPELNVGQSLDLKRE